MKTDIMLSNNIKNSTINWQLKISVSEFDVKERILRVTGDTHIGGVIFQLVEQLYTIKNDWSNFSLWWPDKNEWLNKTKMTLDQYGVQGDAVLQFTRTHKPLRIQLPDTQIIDMNCDYSTHLFYSIKKVCGEIGIRYSEEVSFLKVPYSADMNQKTLKKKENNLARNKDVINRKDMALDSNSVSSSSTLNNTLSNNSSSIRFRSNNSVENLNYDQEGLILSPAVPVQNYLTYNCTKYKNIFDKTKINAKWLDSGKSLMEQGVLENDLVQLKFKYFAFHELLNEKIDAVRINQIYEQAKWAILSEEIDSTDQELINFGALQLQCQLQTKNLLIGNGSFYPSESDELNTDLNINSIKSFALSENSTIFDEDDVDTALNKLEKSLDIAHITKISQNNKEESKNISKMVQENKNDFKLELAEDLYLIKPGNFTFKKSKSFHFVLDSTCYLSYFKCKDDSKIGRPIDKICLKSCELVPDVNVSNKKFGINLKVPSMDGMTEISLRCSSEKSYARWLSACKLAARNKPMSEQAFINETNSILDLLQLQQNKDKSFNGKMEVGSLDMPDNSNVLHNKTMSLSSYTKSIDSRASHFENENTQANNLLTLRMLKKYKTKQLNDKILEAYSAISHLELHESKWHYIKAWQALPSYGITYFTVKIKGSRYKEEIIGVSKNRLLRINSEGETTKTWRFNTMKSWNVNWEIKQFEIIFDEEYVVFTCLNCEPKILHEFIGGYIYLSLRSQEKAGPNIDEDMFLQLTEKR